jgi:hypothetical protein
MKSASFNGAEFILPVVGLFPAVRFKEVETSWRYIGVSTYFDDVFYSFASVISAFRYPDCRSFSVETWRPRPIETTGCTFPLHSEDTAGSNREGG